jgi:hypothetical protein
MRRNSKGGELMTYKEYLESIDTDDREYSNNQVLSEEEFEE